uniref:Uncharacterized protein n=1 Tax=Anopheles funestus TaxID=62324 RepID=A0A182RWH4_ANOFN
MQKQFDKGSLEISSSEDDVLIVDSVERDHQMAERLHLQYQAETVELFSDSDDEVILQATEMETTMPSKIAKKRRDLNNDEFFMDELQVYVIPKYNFEWKFIDVLPDIAAIFTKFDALYFQYRFKNKK